MWLPIVVTFAVMRFIIELLDNSFAFIPASYQPAHLIGMSLPGLGVIFSLVLLFLTGLVATNFFGQRLFAVSESVLNKIPLVRSIYNSAKQVIRAILSTNGQAFRKVLLVEYPRKGMWSIAFQTSEENSLIDATRPNDYVCVFIPTTPNPTSGFLMIVPRSDTKIIDMTTDEALKFVISLGVMQPGVTDDELQNKKVF